MFNTNQWIDSLKVAEDTKVLLKELVKRKDKKEQLKTRLICLGVINCFITTMVVFWLLKISAMSHANIFGVMDYFGSSRAAGIFLVLSASSFIYTGSLSKEYKKKKDKYEKLREEVARKISASWKITEDSKMKDEISEVLKSHNDINIRFTAL
ncbi:hypothetical protein SD70_20030 [Gordoniibacillus kamchatkensis]|uniref:DUF2663 family protein n=1 Tax=Gordoniibacillus kamchatkensis TaxID=1590651 RepID=A0ABR5AEZ3_9BACL|nr:DUF2663 family protein [Paenibacillus sp. VKM B-2647]KIL39457.1 hypothetical protein SD70_20030 [Paenibacillus sp. VKM B-2647]